MAPGYPDHIVRAQIREQKLERSIEPGPRRDELDRDVEVRKSRESRDVARGAGEELVERRRCHADDESPTRGKAELPP